MSKPARILINKIKEYSGDKLEYDICDIEWYAHRFVPRLLDGWFKKIIEKREKNKKEPPTIHSWYLPPPTASAYKGFVGYVKDSLKESHEKFNPFEFEWTDNTKQIYHYLCSEYLNCDFNLNEFKKILEVGSKYRLNQIQAIVEKKRNSGTASIDYLAAIMEREEQAKNVSAMRSDNKIVSSQNKIIIRKAKPLSRTLTALMKREFFEIKARQDGDRMMRLIRGKIK